jgi:rubrerythrin
MHQKNINDSFTGIEMFKFAMLMEDEGYNAYINGANYTTGKTKEFLLYAAKQELVHKERFTKLSTELSSILKTDTDYTFDKETTKYLRDLIENRVFNKKKQTNDSFKDLKLALNHSLKSELLTISIYTQMYERVSKDAVSRILSIIIKEEKAHASYLLQLIKEQ